MRHVSTKEVTMKLPRGLGIACAIGAVLSVGLAETEAAADIQYATPPPPLPPPPLPPGPPQPQQPLTPRQFCFFIGFYWSDVLEQCFFSEAAMCEAEHPSFVWDERFNMCLRSPAAIACYESDGLWDEDNHRCILPHELYFPDTPFPDPDA